MTFSYTQDGKAKFHGTGGEITFGRWTNSATSGTDDIGGDIGSGANVACELMLLSNTGSAVEVTVPAVNEVHPGPAAQSIINGTGDDGVYFALVR